MHQETQAFESHTLAGPMLVSAALEKKRAHRGWTEAELEELRRTYTHTPIEELAAKFGKCTATVRRTGQKLGLVKERSDAWTAEEVAILERDYGHVDVDKLADSVRKSVSSVMSKAFKLRLRAHAGWTAEEISRLGDGLVQGKSVRCLAEEVGRSEGQVRYAIEHFELYSLLPEKEWPATDIEILQQLVAQNASFRVMANKLNRPGPEIQKKCHDLKLGLRKTADEMKPWSPEEVGRLSYLVSRGAILSQITEDLHRTPRVLRRKCAELGLRIAKKPRWSREQKLTLDASFGKVDMDTLCEKLCKTPAQILVMAERRGLTTARRFA
jgi:hypothetical protein